MAERNNNGQFVKGHSGAKPKGAVSAKTKQWEWIGEYITEEGAKRFAEVMSASEDKEFMSYYLAILDYFKPRQSRVDQTNSGNVNVNITKRVVQDEPTS